MNKENSTMLYLNCSNFKIRKNNKIKNIINLGEMHGFSPEFKLDPFIDKKTCFYCENEKLFFKKYVDRPYFNYAMKMLVLLQNFDLDVSDKTIDNLINLSSYFSYYYKKHNYEFSDDYDKELIKNSKPYNELWHYCPCDYRHHIFNKYLLNISILIKEYLFSKNIYVDKNFDKVNIYMHLNSINLNLIYLETFENFVEYCKSNFKDHLDEEIIYKRIYYTLLKYYNEDYYKIIDNCNIVNINNYFNKYNITDIIIDFFNISTWFHYENDLKRYPIIIKFIEYLYTIYFPNNLIIFGFPEECIILIYDIIVYIKFLKNLEKYDYHVIYSGAAHQTFFNEFITFCNINNYITNV